MKTIVIGIMSLTELRDEMIAVARGAQTIAPDAPKLWFESMQALANALKTDVATVEKLLVPASNLEGSQSNDERIDKDRAAYVISFETEHGQLDPQLTARLEALFSRTRDHE